MAKRKATRSQDDATPDDPEGAATTNGAKKTTSGTAKRRGRPRSSTTGRSKSRTQTRRAKSDEEAAPKKRGRPPAVEDDEESTESVLRKKLATARGTTERTILAARIAVAAVASEKTTETRQAQREQEDAAQEVAQHTVPGPGERRSPEDMFAFFRDSFNHRLDKDPYQSWRDRTGTPRHALAGGASLNDLEAAEDRLAIVLPPSYWDFCLEWGSGLFFLSPWREIRFIAIGDIVDELKGTLEDAMLRPFLPIVALNGDYLALDTMRFDDRGENPVVWWHAGEVIGDVESSFADWLRKFCEHYGDAYWLED